MALPYRILVVEDDDATRLRTAEVIQQHADLALAGVAMDCASALRAHGELAPDAILCDLGLPDGSGIDLIRAINAEDAPPLIMVLSNFGDEVHVVEAIKAGACAVGVGSALLDKQAIADNNFSKLTENARILKESIEKGKILA